MPGDVIYPVYPVLDVPRHNVTITAIDNVIMR